MAIAETIVAIPLFWWVATETGILLPLLIGVCIAPLLLLRSEESIALGVRWALKFNYFEIETEFRKLSAIAKITISVFWIVAAACTVVALWSIDTRFDLVFSGIALIIILAIYTATMLVIGVAIAPFLAVLVSPFIPEVLWLIQSESFRTTPLRKIGSAGLPFGLLVLSLGIRFVATCKFLPTGLRNMPRNFRILTLCTSPAQKPELIPGLGSRESDFSLQTVLRDAGSFFGRLLMSPALLVIFGPAWLYRLSIKSTAWFWFPLAFLGGDVSTRRNPDLLRWRITGSLWAKTTILVSFVMIASFLATNLIKSGAIFESNPLLTPLGYLLLIDWTPRIWQISAIAVSVVSIVLVFMMNSVSGEYRIARATNDQPAIQAAERKLDFIQRFARLRLLCSSVFWLLVAAQAFLYFNGQNCWIDISPTMRDKTKAVFGNRLPPNDCSIKVD